MYGTRCTMLGANHARNERFVDGRLYQDLTIVLTQHETIVLVKCVIVNA